jgi:sugar phosphate isomerase/epimerase
MSRYRSTIELFGRHAPGVPLVTISGAAPGGDFRHAFEVAVMEYSALADYAFEHGVRIALEPLNPILMNVDSFLCTVPDAMEIVEAVNRPNFGIWIDVWHIWQDPAAAEHIRQCRDRIFGVHINDWRRPRHFGDRYIVGTGQIDLPPLFEAIRDTGYKGAYTLEIFSSEWLEGSLWKGDMDEMIRQSRAGFEKAWEASF